MKLHVLRMPLSHVHASHHSSPAAARLNLVAYFSPVKSVIQHTVPRSPLELWHSSSIFTVCSLLQKLCLYSAAGCWLQILLAAMETMTRIS
eukprot:5459340-Amphidinium_carterae.2